MQEQAPLQFIPWPRQQEVFKAFLDDETNECLFGGSVNCGKTYILCVFLIYVCQNYPGTRWGLGRKDLANLKKTTLNKFWEVCDDLGYIRGKDFNTAHIIYREHKNEIEFGNGSKILLLDLYYYPVIEHPAFLRGKVMCSILDLYLKLIFLNFDLH